MTREELLVMPPGEVTALQAARVIRDQLLAQGRRSVNKIIGPGGNEVTRCRYRGDDGCMCAIGVLIPDSRYRANMDNECTPIAILRELGYQEHVSADIIGLVKIHDAGTVSDWDRLTQEFIDNLESDGAQ